MEVRVSYISAISPLGGLGDGGVVHQAAAEAEADANQ